MIPVTSSIAINPGDIRWAFSRASGPGGQHVNKTASAVQLRFQVDQADLPPDVRQRLRRIAGHRMAADGTLVIDARRFRSQFRNREDALARLVAMLRQAAHPPARRKKTRPSQGSKIRRMEAKRRRSMLKRHRRPVGHSDD